MKRTFRYFRIVAIAIILFIGTNAFAQTGIEDIRYNFTGNKSRFVVDLTGKSEYTVTEDWLDRIIVIEFPGVTLKDAENYSPEKWKNYIVEDARLDTESGNLKLILKTHKDFAIRYSTIPKGSRYVFDVYPRLEQVGPDVLLKRAHIYENRREYDKAIKLFSDLIELNPAKEDEYRFNLGMTYKLNGQGDEALDQWKQVKSESLFFEQSGNLIARLEKQVDNTKKTADASPVETESENKSTNIENQVDSAAELQQQKLTDEPEGNAPVQQVKHASIVPVTPNEVTQKQNPKPERIDVQEILKESGSENVILYSLYGVLGLVSIIVFFLFRKLIREYRKPKKNKAKVTGTTVRPAIAKRKTAAAPQDHAQEVRAFAKKLSAMYAKTEAAVPKKEPAAKSKPKRTVETVQDHTRKIEEIFSADREKVPFDSEAERLIKKFRDNDVTASNTPDKFRIVKELAEKNWEPWEIARELSIGIEEVKMAIRHSKPAETLNNQEVRFDKIYQMNDLNIPESEIADRLRIDLEQVRLALKLRGADSTVLQTV